MKLSNAQMAEIHWYMKQTGKDFETAKKAMLSYPMKARREDAYAERRAEARMQNDAVFSATMGAVLSLGRGRR